MAVAFSVEAELEAAERRKIELGGQLERPGDLVAVRGQV
jgi:hypothetical protein